jgi:hypothetical protein
MKSTIMKKLNMNVFEMTGITLLTIGFIVSLIGLVTQSIDKELFFSALTSIVGGGIISMYGALRGV